MLRAGFGRSDITPRVGVQLYGFGPYLNRNSIGVRDPLEARAAAFELAGKRAVLIGCDLCTLRSETVERIREAIRERHPELAPADILVSCSHTHSGPATVPEDMGWGAPDPVYMEMLPGRIARAALLALADLAEVETAAALVPCEGIGLNRIYDRDAPPLAEVLDPGWRPAKPELTDTRCRVIRFTAPGGALRGFLAYFGCHPVVCCQETRYIHGDYPGVALHNLMRQFPDSTGIFLQGAEGDVNSCVVHKPEKESLLALDVIAGRFEYAVRQGLEKAEPLEIDRLETLAIPVDFSARSAFTREHILEIKRRQEELLHNPATDESSHAARMARVYLEGARKMLTKLGETTARHPVSGLRLGPVAFLGAPFEIMQGIKNEVTAAATAPIPLVLSLVNGAAGYAPDRERQNAESYESSMVPFMLGYLPYTRIHEELAAALLELDRRLAQE